MEKLFVSTGFEKRALEKFRKAAFCFHRPSNPWSVRFGGSFRQDRLTIELEYEKRDIEFAPESTEALG